MVEIPDSFMKRMEKLGPHFCLVEGKNPSVSGAGWQLPENLMHAGDPKLQAWLSKGKNYGVVTGYGLIVIEADHEKIKRAIEEKLPPTFAVLSPGHNTPHYYFLCSIENCRPLLDPEDKNENIGHIKAQGGMVVGPGSIHPDTHKKYEILHDRDLAQVTPEQVRQALEQYIPEKQIKQVEATARLEKQESHVDLDILQVVPLAGLHRQGDEYFGSHPIHGSETKRNFWVNPSKNCWHCFRHESGGGPLLWLAVEEGIIRCEDAGPGALKGELFKQVLQKAVERGYIKEAKVNVKQLKGDFSLGECTLQLVGSNVVLSDKHGKPVWSCAARDLQEKARKKELAERFQIPLDKVDEASAQVALTQATEEEEEKPRAVIKVSGKAEEGYYEAIYHEDKPAFLVYSDGKFKILNEVHEGDVAVEPPTREMCPYPPYHYHPEPIDIETLRREVYVEYKTFVDAEENYRHRWTTETFQSYQLEKLMTIGYELLVGPEGSGKSHTATVMKYLMYRALWGVSIPAADIYTYLSMHPFGSIIEDEIQGIEKDIDKKKVYLAGYQYGAVIPRIFDLPNGTRIIKYFPCFGFKFCAGRRIVDDPAFMERFNIAYMMEGYPEKDMFTHGDVERLLVLRDKLLKWRLQNMDTPLPEVDAGVTGRLKELWTPLLQVGRKIGLEREIQVGIKDAYQEMRRKREESIEAAILKATVSALLNNTDEWIPSENIWPSLTAQLEGVPDKNKPYLFHSSDYGDVTKQLVGYRLRDTLGAQKKDVRHEGRVVKAYQIPEDKMLRLIRRYVCSQVAKFTPSREDNRVCVRVFCPYLTVSEKSLKQASLDETGKNNASLKLDLGTQFFCKNETVAPSKMCKLSNLATGQQNSSLGPGDVTRLARLHPQRDGECARCKRKTTLDFQLETEEGTRGLVCVDCATEIRRQNPEVEWLE